MNNEQLNYKEARELILHPGKGRFQLLDKILMPKEIMAESVCVLLHRTCSRLAIRKEEVSYIGFYNWVQSYRIKEKSRADDKQLPESSATAGVSETQPEPATNFNFSDPVKIKNNQSSTTEIKFI